MEVLFERIAGLDIAKGSVTVCVRTPGAGGRRRGETRTFKTMTRSLVVMRDWLVECGVTIAARGDQPEPACHRRAAVLEQRLERGRVASAADPLLASSGEGSR